VRNVGEELGFQFRVGSEELGSRAEKGCDRGW